MRVLMLSQDMNALEDGSAVSKRLISYGSIFDSLTVVVFGVGERRELPLAPNVRIVAPGGIHKLDALLKGRASLIDEIRAEKPDIVSVQDPFFVGAMALLVCRSRKIPIQVQVHTDCFSFGYAFSSFRNLSETIVAFFVLKGASGVRVVSERIARNVRRITRAAVSTLPIRVPEVPGEALPRPAAFRENRFTLVAVSRLTSEKRIRVIIDAMRELPDVDLLIVGDGPLLNDLKLKTKNYKLETRIFFVGWQNPHPFYVHADAFIQASRYEGYGMSLAEAALHGLPIITTDVGIAGELLKDRESALVVEPSAHAFARAARRLIEDETLRRKIGETARKNVASSLVSDVWYLEQYQASLRACLTSD